MPNDSLLLVDIEENHRLVLKTPGYKNGTQRPVMNPQEYEYICSRTTGPTQYEGKTSDLQVNIDSNK